MESAEKFLQMETEAGLNECTFEGYSYWTYNRFSMFNYIDEKVNERNPQTFTPRVTKKALIRFYLRAIFDRRCNLKRGLQNGEILVFAHPRRVNRNGKYECVYTDDIVKELKNVRVVEAPYELKHFVPAATDGLLYLDRIELYNSLGHLIMRHFRKKKYRYYEQEFDRIGKGIADLIHRYFGIMVSGMEVGQRLLGGFLVYIFTKKPIERMIKNMNPKVIVECVSYCTPTVMIANEYAKAHDIRTIELQHGVMGMNHMGYNYLIKNVRQFPERILTYSEYWNRVTRLPLEPSNVIACGYPFFERRVAELRAQGMKRKKQVVFISQTVIGMVLNEFAADLYERVKDDCGYEFVYKLHPGEYADWRERYPRLAKSGIKVYDSNEVGIYELFAQSSIQIGVFSTAVYEGLGFGLKTFLVRAYRSEDMEELCSLGYATMVDSIEPIAEYLLNSHEEQESSTYSGFWKEHAAENIVKEIRESI